MRHAIMPTLLVAFLAGDLPASAAQIFDNATAGAVLEIDPSVRSAGMGSAATAAFWGIDPNHWANPALLGCMRGIRYEQGNTDYLDGLEVRSQRTTMGGGGLGIAAVGQPFEHAGKIESDFSIDFGGGPVTFADRVRSWGVGASLGQLSETVSRALGRAPPSFTRFADVAIGFAEKRLEEIASGGGSGPGSPAYLQRAVARDWGLLVKAGVPVRLGPLVAGRLEGAYGSRI